MATRLKIAVIGLLTLASIVFVLGWLWRWIQIFLNTPVLGVIVDNAGRPVIHPANYDTFPYLSVAFACGLLAILLWVFPERFSLRDLLLATTLVAVVLGLGVWLAS